MPADRSTLPGLGSTPGALLDSATDVVQLRSASAQVADAVRREIQRGDHPPRARLRQRDVAARLGVSPTPVREAFQVLQAEGFLVIESHRGAVVVQPSAADITEGYAIRGSLERLAIREAAARFDVDAEPALRELVLRMRRATVKDRWAALDHELHHRLHLMTGMPRLVALIDSLRGGVAFYIESAFEDPRRRRDADDDHVALLDACAAGDGETAEELIGEHLAKTARVVLASLSDAGADAA